MLANGLLVAVGGTLLLVVLRVAASESPPAALAPVSGASGAVYRHPPAVVRGEPRVGPVVVKPPARAPILPRPPAKRKPLLRTPMERAKGGETVTVMMTAYCLKGTTRLGHPVRLGIVAADPRYFPLGRDVDVSIGRKVRARYRVDDTGSAIKGLILDLWTPSCADARKFGRRFGTATLVERK